MKTKFYSLPGLVVLLGLTCAQGQVISDNFDSYPDQAAFQAVWKPLVSPGCTLVNNRVISSPNAVYQATTAMSSCRTNTPITTADIKLSFWFYDGNGSSLGRSWIETTAATTAPKTGLAQLLAIGKNNGTATTKYCARVAMGGTNWFVLNGAANRTTGWHFLEIIGRADNWVDFKVDGALGGSAYVGAYNFNWVDIGSGLSSSTEAWYDDVNTGPIVPVIIQQPTNQTVNVGNPATFTVVASGPGASAMSYQWYRNGQPIAQANDSSYTTPQVGCSDGATFYVECNNGTGVTTSQQATLTVADVKAPAITCPADISVQATSAGGAPVTFTASATDNCDSAPTVTCTPASGSMFPAGTTTVVCTASDAAGNSTNCTFQVMVTPLCTHHFFMANLLPPTNGIYLDRGQGFAQFPNGIAIRNTGWKLFSAAVPPPAPGAPVFHNFTSKFEMELSLDGGLTWASYTADVQNTLRINYLMPDADGALYDVAIPQFDVSGGGLPAGVIMRASPTHSSAGQTRVAPITGGNMLCSFFDIFLEISVDGGLTWSAAQSPAHIELKIDPESVPGMQNPTTLQPPLTAGYQCMCTMMGWCHTAPGLWLKGCRHRLFSEAILPPLLSVTNFHSYNFQWDFLLSNDGGTTTQPGRAPATATIRMEHIRDFSGKSTYRTEVTSFNITGGDLPPGVILRTKPGLVSEGGTCIAPTPPGGAGYILNSFFDIFTEISIDGGLTWQPLNDGPCHVVAQPIAPTYTFPNELWPPPTGEWATTGKLSFASGIIISNLALKSFDASISPPGVGDSKGHSCNFQASMMLSTDGGLTFAPASAPGLQTFVMSYLQNQDATIYYDSEMLTMSFSGGDLPGGLLLRESPTRQSKSQVGQTMRPLGGYHYDISSFFDIFCEVSTDGGATWQPASSGVLTLYMQPSSSAPALLMTCPTNITVTVTSPDSVTVNYPPPVTSGGCPPVTVICNPPSGSLFPPGTTAVNCSAQDTCSQVAQCGFSVTVLYAPRQPVIVQQPQNTNGACGGTAIFTVIAAGSSPLSYQWLMNGSLLVDETNSTLLLTNLSLGLNGAAIRVSVSNPNGSVLSDIAYLTVLDLLPPVITCPSNMIVGTTPQKCSAVVDYPVPQGWDACSQAIVRCDPASGSVFPVGDTTVLCSAVDLSGNSNGCTFIITVKDSEAPIITWCPASFTIMTTPEKCSALVSYQPPIAIDNCGVTNIICNPPSPATLPLGPALVQCTAYDAAGNGTTCSFTVTVVDSEAPVIICPPNQVTNTLPGECFAKVDYPLPTATDNCTVTNIACLPPPLSTFPSGVTTVTCTAADNSGNLSRCTFSVTVLDVEPPAVSCPGDIKTGTDDNQCSRSNLVYTATASDNCPGLSLACTPPSGSTFPQGLTRVTCTATDASGNTNTCTFTVQVLDQQAPGISCPKGAMTFITDPGQCSKSNVFYQLTVSDNCDPNPSLVCLPPEGSTFPVGLTTVVCTATDASGNTNTCNFMVGVRDTELPQIICPSNLCVMGYAPTGAVVNFSAPIASDNCGVASLDCLPPAGSLFPLGSTIVACTATDKSGNSSSCNFTIRVVTPCPKLSISLRENPQIPGTYEIWVCWPADNSDCALQYTDSLNPVIAWQAWTGPIINQGGSNCVRISDPTRMRFFRLYGHCSLSP